VSNKYINKSHLLALNVQSRTKEVTKLQFRWDSISEDISVFISLVKKSVRKVLSKINIKPRGRPPKRSRVDYITLLVLKEDEKKSLRGTERRLSHTIFKERIDHSVIAFWEKKADVQLVLEEVIREIGKALIKNLPHDFTMVDATKFSNWKNEEIMFHLCNRICSETVYPTGISFLTGSVKAPVNQAVDHGEGKLYADAGYDDNATLGVIFEKGYEPIVCPNSQRRKGYYRRKARKLYRMLINRLGYRQRGRGESCFGSLTNKFGDRLKVINEQVMRIRITARVISYQIKLLIRAIQRLLMNY